MKTETPSLTPEQEASIEHALANDRGPQPNEAVGVRYSKVSDTFVLQLRSGLALTIPRRMIPEIAHIEAGSSILTHVGIFGAGYAITWDDVDIAVKTFDIIANALSQAPTASQMGKRGGSAKSLQKASAARENGRKGGRPRKKAA